MAQTLTCFGHTLRSAISPSGVPKLFLLENDPNGSDMRLLQRAPGHLRDLLTAPRLGRDHRSRCFVPAPSVRRKIKQLTYCAQRIFIRG